jgi:hypothetical protein
VKYLDESATIALHGPWRLELAGVPRPALGAADACLEQVSPAGLPVRVRTKLTYNDIM